MCRAGRRSRPLPTVDIDIEYPFPRGAREDDVEVVHLVFHPESRVASPPAHPCLRVCETELPYDVIDTPLTLLSGRNRIWPIDGGISLPIAAVIISRSRCHHQRKNQPDAPKHRSPPGGLLKRSIRAHPLVANNQRLICGLDERMTHRSSFCDLQHSWVGPGLRCSRLRTAETFPSPTVPYTLGCCVGGIAASATRSGPSSSL